MKVNDAGLALIKNFEGCKLKAYQDQGGVWTIGYGWAQNVKPTDVWTQEQAEKKFVDAVSIFSNSVYSKLGDNSLTTPNQFSAMVSLAYNIGIGNFSKSSVLRFHKEGNYAKAADSFLLWNKVKGEINKGLTRRRTAERALYLED